MGFQTHRKKVYTKQAIEGLKTAFGFDEPISIMGRELTIGKIIVALEVKLAELEKADGDGGKRPLREGERRVSVEEYKATRRSGTTTGRFSSTPVSSRPRQGGPGLADEAATDHDVQQNILRHAASAMRGLPD